MSDSFFTELKRRNVFKVGAAYLVLAWVIIQVTSEAVPALHLPEWVNSFIFLLGAIGFPFALFFAWAFELTPEGIKKEAEVDRTESITSDTGQKLNYAIIALLVMALAYFIYERQTTGLGGDSASELAEGSNQASDSGAQTVEASIAVLPFTNMSGDDANLPFTMGIHDDLLTHISRIKALKTTSRTSVMQYRDTTKTIPQIGKELNVKSILEGSIQRAGSQVRINMQLIDTTTDEHIWAEIFNRELTTENLFKVQGEIAEAVAHALRVALLPEEKATITQAPTESMAAYDLYLLGRHEWNQRTAESLAKARDYFTQALQADPSFVKAMSGLADSYLMLHSYGIMTGDEALPKAKEQIDSAMALNDSVSEVWASLGLYATARVKPIEAEKAFKRAIELDEKNFSAWMWYASFLQRPDVRRYVEAKAAFLKAFELEPMHKVINRNMSIMYDRQGDFENATKHANTIISIDSERAKSFELMNADRKLESGNIAEAIYNFREILAKDPSSEYALSRLARAYSLLGDFETAKIWAKRTDDLNIRAGSVANLLTEQGDYQGAIDNHNKILERTNDPNNFNYIGSMVINYALLGDVVTARKYFDTLIAALGNNIKANPSDARPIQTLYFSYFWLINGSDSERETAINLAKDVIDNTEKLIEQGFNHPNTYFAMAFANFLISDKENGYKNLDKAIDRGFRSQFQLSFMRMASDLENDSNFQLRLEQLQSYAAIEAGKLEKMSLADYIPLKRDAVEVTQSKLQDYEGYFTNGNALWHFYLNKQGELMMQMGQRRLEKLIPVAINEFYPELEIDVTYEFVEGESGQISHVFLNDTTRVRLKRASPPPPYISLPISKLKKYEGSYSYTSMPDDPDNPKNFVWIGVLSVDKNGNVIFDLNNQPALEIQPFAMDEFDIPGFTATLKFLFDDGAVQASRIIFYGDGNEVIFYRDE